MDRFCAAQNKKKQNFSFDNDKFTDLQVESEYPHVYGALARYNGNPLAIGSSSNTKVEIFQNDAWKNADDYPTRYLVIKSFL